MRFLLIRGGIYVRSYRGFTLCRVYYLVFDFGFGYRIWVIGMLVDVRLVEFCKVSFCILGRELKRGFFRGYRVDVRIDFDSYLSLRVRGGCLVKLID